MRPCSRCSVGIFFLLAGLVMLLGTTGCVTKSAKDPAITFADLDAAVPVGLNVDSFGGDVLVRVDPKLDHAEVRLVRKGVHGMMRGEEANAALTAINIETEMVEADDGGKELQVRLTTEHAEPHFLRANVEIVAPAIEGVRIRTKRGKVYLWDVAGTVFIENAFGHVRLMSTRPMVDPVTIINRDGDIDYRIQRNSAGVFDCQTVRGTVSPRIKQGNFRALEGTREDTLIGVLNGGTNRVELRTVDGNIRIAIVEEPSAVGYMIR